MTAANSPQQTPLVNNFIPQIQKEVITYTKSFRFNISHLIFMAYFLVIFLRRFFYIGFSNFLVISFWLGQILQLITWFSGAIIGWNFSVFDNVAYLYVTHPESPQALQAKNLFSKNIIRWFKYLVSLENTPHQVSRSILFQVAWIVLSGFAITSTVGGFGKAIVMGIGLKILLQNWQLQSKNPQALNSQLFWQIKRPVTADEQKKFLWIFTAIFVLLTLLM